MAKAPAVKAVGSSDNADPVEVPETDAETDELDEATREVDAVTSETARFTGEHLAQVRKVTARASVGPSGASILLFCRS